MFEKPSNFESFVHIVMSCLSKHGDFVPVEWIKEHTGTNHYDAFLSRMMSIAKERGHTLVIGEVHIYCLRGKFS